MHGGLKIYRGAAAAARHYVEADRSRADDYYLAEGTGVAARLSATPDGVRAEVPMDGTTYEQWVAGYDVVSGMPKGRLRTDDQAVRFVEVTVNGPKTWSLAAALHPEIAAAYDGAQDHAAEEIVGWLAEHATTRIGPRGRQVQVPVEQIEAAVVRHYTSRAGDPHRHLHLQINARVWADRRWRGLHTVGVRDSLEAINGIGHAAVMTDPGFRNALAAHGYRLDPESGEVVELVGYAGAFSARARQIEQNVDRYEAEWRAEHPEEEPGPALRRTWDRRAWSDARPDKVVPISGADLAARWVDELTELGFSSPEHPQPAVSSRVGELDREELVATALMRLGSRRSAWNAADARGEAEHLIAAAGIVTEPAVRRELAEDLASRVVDASRSLLGRADVLEHVRSLTSPHVLDVERELIERIASGAATRDLTIVEGAAGSGKTTRLAATRETLERQGERMLVVSPIRKAAAVAAHEVGAPAHSVAWLLHRHGYRWDDDGRWTHGDPSPDAPGLDRRTLIVVDEAGMLDQDTARALLELAGVAASRVTLIGDRHQLPAVGCGGVLDLAVRYAPERCVEPEGVRRFNDPAYAELSLKMRRGEASSEVFEELVRRGEIVLHASDVERQQVLAAHASRGELVVADTREQVGRINGLAHQVRVATGEAVDDIVTAAGERIGVGDRVATRRNDSGVGVANRELWTVVESEGGRLTVDGEAGRRSLPAEYVDQHVELAYATTAYGAQGSTVTAAHILVGEHTGAASAYVGMTRGRERNVAHLVAESHDDARRHRADLGPQWAAQRAVEAVDRFGPQAPKRRAWVPEPARRREPDVSYRRPERSGRSIGF